MGDHGEDPELVRLLAISRAFKASHVLNLAGKLQVFSLCSEAPGGLTCSELVAKLGWCGAPGFRGAADFLDLLVSLNTLQRLGEGVRARYQPHPACQHLLLQGSPSCMTGILQLNHDRSFPLFCHLEEALVHGQLLQQPPGVPSILSAFSTSSTPKHPVTPPASPPVTLSPLDPVTLSVPQPDIPPEQEQQPASQPAAAPPPVFTLASATLPERTTAAAPPPPPPKPGKLAGAAAEAAGPSPPNGPDGPFDHDSRKAPHPTSAAAAAAAAAGRGSSCPWAPQAAAVAGGAEHFALGMLGASLGNFRMLATAFDFSSYNTVLDIGGSCGCCCVALCGARPHMHATTADLPAVRQMAETYVSQHEMSDRVKVLDLDFFSPDPFPAADVVIMGMVLHDWGLAKKVMLMRKALAALPPGGAFIAVDNLIDDQRRTATIPLAMSLNMLLEFGRESAFDYSFSEFQSWAEDVGFSRCAVLPLQGCCAAAVAFK